MFSARPDPWQACLVPNEKLAGVSAMFRKSRNVSSHANNFCSEALGKEPGFVAHGIAHQKVHIVSGKFLQPNAQSPNTTKIELRSVIFSKNSPRINRKRRIEINEIAGLDPR